METPTVKRGRSFLFRASGFCKDLYDEQWELAHAVFIINFLKQKLLAEPTAAIAYGVDNWEAKKM